MSDEAFALSPISARAAQPREEDYDAIREAFMETSRGRWFLGEFAKRNRNADTRMVLDAVARIEETLAAQVQPAPETGLAEALAAITSALEEARVAALAALDSLALKEALAPIRKGVRVIREISWRWREIGADGRICDLIDSQLSAMEAGYGQISSAGATNALAAAFDLIEARIAALEDGDQASLKAAEAAVPSPSPAPSDDMPAAVAADAQAATATNDAEGEIGTSTLPVEAAVAAAEVADVTAKTFDTLVKVEVLDVMVEVADAEAADAHDEAVLDLVAIEMAAPDPFDTDYASDSGGDPAEESPAAEPVIAAERSEPTAVVEQPPAIAPEPSHPPSPESSLQLPPQPIVQSALKPSLQHSLGSTLIATGIVRRSNAASDPMAPIRRLSQAEKIALFS